jgi:transposase
VRHFQRLKQRLRAEGLRGLVHQGRGRPSSRRAERLRQQVGQLLQTTYVGFNDCHLTEKLQEREGLSVSREFVRRVRVAPSAGYGSPARPSGSPRRSAG